MDYLESFQNLISNRERLLELLRGSHFVSDSFVEWETHRKFIAQAINQNGIILDIGCANGFFLRCLAEWTGFTLNPFGVDADSRLVGQARALFSENTNHFVTLALEDINQLSEFGLPEKYSLIYWNVWDDWSFTKENETREIEKLLAMREEKGRLILGFYHNDKGSNRQRIENLVKAGFQISGQLANPVTGLPEMACWID